MTSAAIDRVRTVDAELNDDCVASDVADADGGELSANGCCATIGGGGCNGDCENRR